MWSYVQFAKVGMGPSDKMYIGVGDLFMDMDMSYENSNTIVCVLIKKYLFG